MSLESGSILSLRGAVLENHPLPGGLHLLRIHQPRLAQTCRPGQFVHLICDPALTLRRPFSLYRTGEGWVEILYKVVGEGTRLLTAWQPGHEADILGPVGKPFTLLDPSRRALLLAGGVGLPPMAFLATHLQARGVSTVLLFGSEAEPPLAVHPARSDDVAGMPGGLAFSDLEAAGIPNRLASLKGGDGVFKGFVTELARAHLDALEPEARRQTFLYTCGPHAMMAAAARLAAEYGLAGEASLEERMACGFGGCAGCVAPIRLDPPPLEGAPWAYRRVCVDGPVFDMGAVVWEGV